jgi:hypothetical protein
MIGYIDEFTAYIGRENADRKASRTNEQALIADKSRTADDNEELMIPNCSELNCLTT